MIGIRMPHIFSLEASSSEGTIKAALRASPNYITTVSQLMFENISPRKVDLNPMVRSSPL